MPARYGAWVVLSEGLAPVTDWRAITNQEGIENPTMTNNPDMTNGPDAANIDGLRSVVSRRRLLALAGGAALLGACSSTAKKLAAPTTVATTAPSVAPTSTSTTVADTTDDTTDDTTEVADTGPVIDNAGSTVVDATASTVAPPTVQPLTGLPLTDPTLLNKVALVVKVSNDPGARPQTGLNDPDIIFEAWGAGPTRFATIWHSRDLDFVGPIRSCREQDVNLVGEFNRAVFACSGGNPGNLALLRSSDLLLVQEGQGPGWELDPKRGRPHKTHLNTAKVRSNAGPYRTGPAQQFHYRAEGAAPTGGTPMSGFDLHIQQVFVQWRWNAKSSTYLRAQDGHPHILTDKKQVSTENVIIAFLDYYPSHTDRRSPDGTTTGTNPALVFTGGQLINATWTRADRLSPFSFTDASGAPVLLTPGRTFIELPNSGKGSFPGNDTFATIV